jgi:hypothetical protein
LAADQHWQAIAATLRDKIPTALRDKVPSTLGHQIPTTLRDKWMPICVY